MLEDLMRKRITHFDNVAFYSPEEELYVTKMCNSKDVIFLTSMLGLQGY